MARGAMLEDAERDISVDDLLTADEPASADTPVRVMLDVTKMREPNGADCIYAKFTTTGQLEGLPLNTAQAFRLSQELQLACDVAHVQRQQAGFID